jgi:transmembrane sensor
LTFRSAGLIKIFSNSFWGYLRFFLSIGQLAAMSQTLFWNLLSKKLAGEASKEELDQLDNLIKSNPAWAYQAEHFHNLWQQAPDKDSYESELAFEQHLNKLKENGVDFPEHDTPMKMPEFSRPSSRKRTRIFALSIGAFLVFAISGISLLSHKKASPALEKNYSEVSSPLGSKTKLVLPDSTVVWLNAGSRLTYNEYFGTTNRKTTLTGEAFFDVKKSSIPFIIHANSVQIKVLGTAFNVKAYPEEKTVETSLIRGRVEITLDQKPGQPIILTPNEKVVVSNEENKNAKGVQAKEPVVVWKGLTRTTDSTIVETSWVNNKIIFQDESFRDIAVKMERWYGIEIEFADEYVADERLSGTFTTETIQEALAALQYSTKFHYSIKGNLITITR